MYGKFLFFYVVFSSSAFWMSRHFENAKKFLFHYGNLWCNYNKEFVTNCRVANETIRSVTLSARKSSLLEISQTVKLNGRKEVTREIFRNFLLLFLHFIRKNSCFSCCCCFVFSCFYQGVGWNDIIRFANVYVKINEVNGWKIPWNLLSSAQEQNFLYACFSVFSSA